MPGWAWGKESWQAELRGKVQRNKKSLWVDFRDLSRTGRTVYSCTEVEGVPRWLVFSPRPKDSMPSLNPVLLCLFPAKKGCQLLET